MSKFKAAVVQWVPCVHDAQMGAEKACKAIADASSMGARLVVFPELWLQGYPYWAGAPVRDDTFQSFRSALFEAGITMASAPIKTLQQAAKAANCYVVIGAHERDGGSLYNTMIYFGDDGSILGKHRKLMPTTTERLVHGVGDGSDLEAYETSVGRLSGLICYEHQMAPARYALCELKTQMHVSAWPGHAFLDPIVDAATRHLAFENACFVLVAREVMSKDKILDRMPESRGSDDLWETHGGSAIIAPGGRYLAGPVFDEETILTADIDLGDISFIKWWVDGTGHYSRPDVFRLHWDRRPKPPVEFVD